MTKCKGCEGERNQYNLFPEGDVRNEYCFKCRGELKYLPEEARIKVLASRKACEELWDVMMNINGEYFLELINDACHDECSHSDDHNIVWR